MDSMVKFMEQMFVVAAKVADRAFLGLWIHRFMDRKDGYEYGKNQSRTLPDAG